MSNPRSPTSSPAALPAITTFDYARIRLLQAIYDADNIRADNWNTSTPVRPSKRATSCQLYATGPRKRREL